MSREQKPRRLPLRRHSLAGSRASPRGGGGGGERRRGAEDTDTSKGKSFFKLLMSRPWKQRRSASSPTINTNPQSPTTTSHHHDNTNKGVGSSILVVATVLQPHLYHKRIPVTIATTVNDIIMELISKYAVVEEDRDPASFYLMETHDRQQGSYSCVLADQDETIDSIVNRWSNGSGYFTLAKATPPATVAMSEPLFSSSPSLLFGGGEDSSSHLQYQACVEEISSSQSQLSQSLTDISTALNSSSKKKHPSAPFPPSQITTLVSPYSHGAASQIKPDTENRAGLLPRLQDTGIMPSSSTFSQESSSSSLLIIDSPPHQYIVTGSTMTGNHSEESFHGNEPSGITHFHFPSANPSSPTDSCHDDTVMDDNPPANGNTANKTVGEEEEEEEEEEKKIVSEMMMMSVESGLGQIMMQVVEEGRTVVSDVNMVEEEEEGEGEAVVVEVEEREAVVVEEVEEKVTEEEMEEEMEEKEEEVEEEVEEEEKEEELEEDEMKGNKQSSDSEKNEILTSTEVIMVMSLESSPRPIARARSLVRMESSLTIQPVVKTTKSYDKPVHGRRNCTHLIKSASVATDTELVNEAPSGTTEQSGEMEDLISPCRRGKLISDAAKRFPFKRAATFDVGVSHTHQTRTGAGAADLVSQRRKDRLMREALASFRLRFSKSPLKTIPDDSN